MMNHTSCCVLLAVDCLVTLLLVVSAVPAAAQDTASPEQNPRVTLDRLSYRDGLSVKDHPDYPQWPDADISAYYRTRTFIARAWEPAPPRVRNVIVIISGQQSTEEGTNNFGTGQLLNYRADWGDKFSDTVQIDSRSLAARIIRGSEGSFSSSDTFLALLFDSQFVWESGSDTKERMLTAYTNWLASKAGGRLQNVIFIGASRGGALAARLARSVQSIGAPWNTSVSILAGLVDAVPNVYQDELDSSLDHLCDNPLCDDLLTFSYRANLTRFYEGARALTPPQVRHIVLGAPVFLELFVHAFCADETKWYNQSWVCGMTHSELTRGISGDTLQYNEMNAEVGWIASFEWAVWRIMSM